MKRLILLLMLLPSLCHGQGAIIDQPTRTAGQISNTTQAWLPIWDQNGGARLTFKMSISELASLAGGLTNGDKGDITLSGSPAGSVWTVDAGKFALLAHTHTIADTTGLQAALDAKLAASVASAYGLQLLDDADAATARVTLGLGTAATQASTAFATAVHSHAIADVTNLQTTLNGKAALVHSHAIADVTGLQTALDAKAALAHTHAIADTTGLQTALDGKAALVHTHAASDIASGTFASARFAANTIPHATLSNTSANGRLIGSPSAGATVGEITIGSGLSLSGSTLTATGGGGTPGGSNTQLQYNNAGAFAGAADVTYSTGQLSVTPAWSGTGTATTPLLVNVTADPGPANAASKLLDLKINNTTVAQITKGGFFLNNSDRGFIPESGSITFINSDQAFVIRNVTAGYNDMIRLTSAGMYLGPSQDILLARDAPDILALRRSNNNQAIRLYDNWTNSTDNFSRATIGFKDAAGADTSTFRIGTEDGSLGGTAGGVSIVTDGIERVQIPATGKLLVAGPIDATTAIGNTSGSAGIGFFGAGNSMTLRNAGVNAMMFHSTFVSVLNGRILGFESGDSGTPDVALARPAANILGVTNGSTGGGAVELTEMTAPPTPAADKCRYFARDNGSGKTQFCVMFSDGSITVLATQP